MALRLVRSLPVTAGVTLTLTLSLQVVYDGLSDEMLPFEVRVEAISGVEDVHYFVDACTYVSAAAIRHFLDHATRYWHHALTAADLAKGKAAFLKVSE